MPSRTNLKLAEVIRHRAAHVILHELKDPRMGFVTITQVQLGPDLTSCKISWSVLGGPSERSKTSHALEHARGFVQRRVAEGLRLRNAPELAFEYDEAVEGAIKMGGLLKQLRTDRGEDPVADAAADAAAQAGESAEGEEAAESDEEESGDTTDDEEVDATTDTSEDDAQDDAEDDAEDEADTDAEDDDEDGDDDSDADDAEADDESDEDRSSGEERSPES